jgi:hypothetical protein
MRKAKSEQVPVAVMTEAEMQAAADKMCLALSDRGLREPVVQIEFNAHAEPNVYYRWTKANSISSCDWESNHIRAKTVAEATEKAWVKINALPGIKERQFTEFMEVVAKAVDVGRRNGIDVEFVNPLTETMKRLSENALMFQGAAE